MKEIIAGVLAGWDTPAKITKEVFGLKPGTDEFAEAKERIATLLDDPGFKRQVARARMDIHGTIKEHYKRDTFRYKMEMDKLAFDAADPRVRFQALKDGLDRGDTAPVQKKTLYFSPADYAEKLERDFGAVEETDEETEETLINGA